MNKHLENLQEITDVKDLEGLVIKKALLLDGAMFILTDNAYCIVCEADCCGCGVELADSEYDSVADCVSNETLRDLGLISEVEYATILKAERDEANATLRKHDIEKLNMLRELYPDD